MFTKKEELLLCLRNFPGVIAEPEIEGECPTRLRVETKSADDVQGVEALLHMLGWSGWEVKGVILLIDWD
jgi:hypothetical protein